MPLRVAVPSRLRHLLAQALDATLMNPAGGGQVKKTGYRVLLQPEVFGWSGQRALQKYLVIQQVQMTWFPVIVIRFGSVTPACNQWYSVVTFPYRGFTSRSGAFELW